MNLGDDPLKRSFLLYRKGAVGTAKLLLIEYLIT